MASTTEPITTTEKTGGAARDSHPAFAVAVVSKRSSHPGQTLFQSDLKHRETIVLSIREASRFRNLMRDSVFPGDHLVEVEMSLAQWGALVSSIGIGAGVPVTLRHVAGADVPVLPYLPRMVKSLAETRGAVTQLLERARETLGGLTEAIEGKLGVKATREALRTHTAALNNAESNAAFAVKSFVEATEEITNQARADIESQILNVSRLTGVEASVELPELES